MALNELTSLLAGRHNVTTLYTSLFYNSTSSMWNDVTQQAFSGLTNPGASKIMRYTSHQTPSNENTDF